MKARPAKAKPPVVCVVRPARPRTAGEIRARLGTIAAELGELHGRCELAIDCLGPEPWALASRATWRAAAVVLEAASAIGQVGVEVVVPEQGNLFEVKG